MLKILGMILIFCTSSGVGILLSNSLSKRVKEIELLLALIEKIETHIRFHQTPTPQMIVQIHKSGQFDELPFVSMCAEKMKIIKVFPIAWRTSVEETASDTHLKSEDIALVYTLSDTLGASDVDGQLSALTLLRQLLQQNLSEALEKKKSHSKMYRTLGVLAGFAVVIMIV